MKPPTPSIHDNIRDKRSQSELDIMHAARMLFLDLGYEGVSMESIAHVAGVARQTVFNRFGSKDAVFRAMVSDHWASWGRALAIEQVPHSAPVEKHLRVIALSIASFQHSPDQIKFQRLVVSESRRFDWIGPASYQSGKGPRMVAFGQHLRQLDAEGRLNCKQPDIAAWQFVGLIQEFLVWPEVMAMGVQDGVIPSAEIVINEAIATFMARYKPDEG